MTPCPSRRRELTELTDGALGVRDTERLNAHLVGCRECREEFASLRRMRDQLRTAGSARGAPPALTDRLLSIAGPAADRPLYARPFDRSRGRALPSRRRRTQQLVAGVMTLTCLLLAGLAGVGWAYAPPPGPPATDPGSVARDEFVAVLGESALANPAVNASRAGDAARAKTLSLTGPAAPAGLLVDKDALALLERADDARFRVAYSGTQLVQVRHRAGYWVTEARLAARPGRGIEIDLPDRAGASRSVLVSEAGSPGVSVVGHTHQLVAAPGAPIAGRPTVVVEARQAGRPSVRWWLDTDTGLVLWEKRFGSEGEVTLSAGYRTIAVGRVEDPRHLPPRLAARGSTANLTLTAATHLAEQGWQFTDQLAGLSLLRVRGDREHPMLHTVYSDGVTTLSVIQQKGALTGPPRDFVWDPDQHAYRSLGLTTMYSWQSGDTVFTVATDGSADVAARAIAELPHDGPVSRTRVDRVVEGWRALVGVGR